MLCKNEYILFGAEKKEHADTMQKKKRKEKKKEEKKSTDVPLYVEEIEAHSL